MKHPTLYKKTSTGEDQYWSVEVTGNRIISRWGRVGGTENRTDDVITEGKNLGKANATTPAEQAKLEAKSLWDKKLKKGYVKSLGDAQAGKTDAVIEGGIFPMLAHKFSEQGHKIVFPAYAQPKLDGHRCIAVLDKNRKCTLWSRTRKQIHSVPHIVKALELMGRANIVLDGELYNHEYRDKFEQLTHFIRQSEPEAGAEIVEYHVYDVQDPRGFRARTQYVDWILSECKGTYPGVHVVETIEVASEDELMLAFEKFCAQGYEGAMVRNADGLYVNKRSYDLQKVKEFDDSEFRIVGVAEGRGKLVGHGIFLCTTKPDTQDFGVVTAEQAEKIIKQNPGVFSAKMKGETTELKKFVSNYPAYAGKQLTVKYQGYTNKSEVPRFPVALRIREE